MVKIRHNCMLCSLHFCAGGLELLHFSELCSAESVAALYFLFSIFALGACRSEVFHEALGSVAAALCTACLRA